MKRFELLLAQDRMCHTSSTNTATGYISCRQWASYIPRRQKKIQQHRWSWLLNKWRVKFPLLDQLARNLLPVSSFAGICCASTHAFSVLGDVMAGKNKTVTGQISPSSGTAPSLLYPHMPIHTPREFNRRAITEAFPTVNFTPGWVADSSDFELLGELNFPKWEILCPGRP